MKIEPRLSISQAACSPYCTTVTAATFVFCALKMRLKEALFKWESVQITLHGRLAFTISQYWLTLVVRYWNTSDIVLFELDIESNGGQLWEVSLKMETLQLPNEAGKWKKSWKCRLATQIIAAKTRYEELMY